MTSQSVMSVDLRKYRGKHLKKDDAWVSSWKQEGWTWMKDDMVTYSKCPRQRMRTTWTLPLRFFVRECILTRKRKIAVISWVHTVGQRRRKVKKVGGQELRAKPKPRAKPNIKRGRVWGGSPASPPQKISKIHTWNCAILWIVEAKTYLFLRFYVFISYRLLHISAQFGPEQSFGPADPVSRWSAQRSRSCVWQQLISGKELGEDFVLLTSDYVKVCSCPADCGDRMAANMLYRIHRSRYLKYGGPDPAWPRASKRGGSADPADPVVPTPLLWNKGSEIGWLLEMQYLESDGSN